MYSALQLLHSVLVNHCFTQSGDVIHKQQKQVSQRVLQFLLHSKPQCSSVMSALLNRWLDRRIYEANSMALFELITRDK